MKTLAPHLERIGTDLDRAARTLAAERRRRRRRVQLVALVAATAAIGTGAGLAAQGFNPIGWLRSDDPSEARYLVDTSVRFDGAAPAGLWCDVSDTSPFPCRESGGERRYEALTRIEAPENLSRESFRAAIDRAIAEGTIPAEKGERMRRDIDAAGADFFERLDLMSSISTIGFAMADEGGDVVPPPGIPWAVTCLPAAAAWQCRDLAGAVGVPVGAPVYVLARTGDWVPAPPRADALPGLDVEAIWGRPLTPAESRLLFDLMTTGEYGSGVSGDEWSETTGTAEPETTPP